MQTDKTHDYYNNFCATKEFRNLYQNHHRVKFKQVLDDSLLLKAVLMPGGGGGGGAGVMSKPYCVARLCRNMYMNTLLHVNRRIRKPTICICENI